MCLGGGVLAPPTLLRSTAVDSRGCKGREPLKK